MSCPYKNILGVPGTGVHETRIFGLALVDIVLTALAALITSYFTEYSFPMSFFMWFLLGEILHYVFGTQTAFLTMIGIKACPDEKNEITEPAYSIGR